NYPVKAEDRRNYRDSAGRGLSSHTFRVYDACAQIPAGKWSSYKAIAMSIASSPRAVGQALRRNPFSPSPIPCHRVLEAKGGIGGFHGQKSPDSFDRKVALLRKEGL
ncbi:MAG: methylated-DNA--cysteine S-met, partial [Piptocephalis tieghemiana]